MAHELNFFTDGRARMAYVGDTPWHGLGQVLTPNAPLETWAKESGMDFQIHSAPVGYTVGKQVHAFPDKYALYRADNGEPLSIVGSKYRVVQPLEVLEFFRNLTKDYGFTLETAGVLFKGQKYWALAKTGEEKAIKKSRDVIKGYVLLATSCDGTLRTVARHTSVRVVCNNTLEMSNRDHGAEVKVSHASQFRAQSVQEQLGLLEDGWQEFTQQAESLADVKITNEQALAFTLKVFGGDATKPMADQPKKTEVSTVIQLFDGKGLGADLKTAKGTAWGLVNAVTEAADWHKGKSQERRLENAWFYTGAQFKRSVFEQAMNDFVLQKAV